MLAMFVLLSMVFLLSTVRPSKSEELIIFDNADYGVTDYGSEEKMVDHALLALDKKMDLPPSFTICSSVHLNFTSKTLACFALRIVRFAHNMAT